jgi:hypothetical protein
VADARRSRLERIRQLRSELGTPWSQATPLARQAAALEVARDEVPWLLAWSPERVLGEVARVATARQQTPSSVYLMRHHPAPFSAVYKFFASYHDVCELVGLSPWRRPGRGADPGLG